MDHSLWFAGFLWNLQKININSSTKRSNFLTKLRTRVLSSRIMPFIHNSPTIINFICFISVLRFCSAKSTFLKVSFYLDWRYNFHSCIWIFYCSGLICLYLTAWLSFVDFLVFFLNFVARFYKNGDRGHVFIRF